MAKWIFYRQLNTMDCGPTCIRMIARYYGKHYHSSDLAQKSGSNKVGVSLLCLSKAAESIGFRTRAIELSLNQLPIIPLPCILHWNQNHFVVLYKINQSRKRFTIADPATGILNFTQQELEHFWNRIQNDQSRNGIALLLEPTPKFYEMKDEYEDKLSWKSVLKYLLITRGKILIVLITLFITSCLQVLFPYLAKRMIDVGINTRNLSYVTLILVAQLTLIFSRTLSDFIRGRVLLIISNLINLSISTDLWKKLSKIGISYFDIHPAGDTLQRINDVKQIQTFLTGPGVYTLISFVNFILFGFVLAFYNIQLTLIFAGGTIAYFIWIKLFLKARKKINYKIFQASAKVNNSTLELVQGMQEIRLNNAEESKLLKWECSQKQLFSFNIKFLTNMQVQQAGAALINHFKDLIITFIVAKLVIEGHLTLGSMIAIQYILGQLSTPIEQFVLFIQGFQDANISIARLNEINELKNEEDIFNSVQYLPKNSNIELSNVTFCYPGFACNPVLRNIDLLIPHGKTTAIVGLSGSGKTTLLKLLLKYYGDYTGTIRIGEVDLNSISPRVWRSHVGAVLQDGQIFNDTLAGNIALGDLIIDQSRLTDCCQMVNLDSFVESLPNGIYTRLGIEGLGISMGQKQRILIARALYKNPKYLMLDEATNSLDAENEKLIINSLREFTKTRTVMVIAHRLSTVKNADNIIVLNNGRIDEAGTHSALSHAKGKYFNLVKDQLELGH